MEDQRWLENEAGVLESAVVGVPHPDFGETVIGVVVAEKGVELDLDQLKQNISGSLARFKQPQKLFVVDELQRNTMGKVQKKVLRDDYQDIYQKP